MVKSYHENSYFYGCVLSNDKWGGGLFAELGGRLKKAWTPSNGFGTKPHGKIQRRKR